MSDPTPGLWRLKVRDDAGMYRRVDLRQWKRSVAARDPITKESMWYARRALGVPAGAATILGIVLAMIGVGLLWTAGGVGPAIAPIAGWDGAMLTYLCAVAMVSAPAAMLVTRVMEGFTSSASARAAVPYMKTIRVCAACAYSLDGVNPSAEGATTCPECGAVWRLDEVNHA